VIVERVEVEREISAAPEVVWRLVSDLPRMGEWSPENTGGEWVKGATGPAAGAKFKGRNAAGSREWSTTATVIDARPAERFSFLVTTGPLKIAEWSFDIVPSESGCFVTQTWIDRRGRLITFFGSKLSGVDDRATFSRESMEQTLAGIAAAAESPSP
jgi:uncharacterized protein YndB with AHSA1/START domain